MFSVGGLVEWLRLFERNRVPLGLKVLGLAMYFQISSLGRAARVLSEHCSVFHTHPSMVFINEKKVFSAY
ncbi:MAG: hypothetical protein QW190_09000 [Thermoproteota archaeon]